MISPCYCKWYWDSSAILVSDAPEEDHSCNQPAEDDHVHDEDEDAYTDGAVELEEGDEGPGGAS